MGHRLTRRTVADRRVASLAAVHSMPLNLSEKSIGRLDGTPHALRLARLALMIRMSPHHSIPLLCGQHRYRSTSGFPAGGASFVFRVVGDPDRRGRPDRRTPSRLRQMTRRACQVRGGLSFVRSNTGWSVASSATPWTICRSVRLTVHGVAAPPAPAIRAHQHDLSMTQPTCISSGSARRGNPIASTAERAVAAQRILAGLWRRGGDGH